MRKWIPWALGGAVLLLLLGRSSGGYTFGGEPIRTGVDRDPSNLLPGFAAKVEKIFQAMRSRGFQPLLWEGYRTRERAEALHAANPKGASEDSMHIYGAAVDIVDGAYYPQKAGVSAGFWNALGQEAERLGLTWGGRWTNNDVRHVQAVPVAKQVAFRAASPAEQAALVA